MKHVLSSGGSVTFGKSFSVPKQLRCSQSIAVMPEDVHGSSPSTVALMHKTSSPRGSMLAGAGSVVPESLEHAIRAEHFKSFSTPSMLGTRRSMDPSMLHSAGVSGNHESALSRKQTRKGDAGILSPSTPLSPPLRAPMPLPASVSDFNQAVVVARIHMQS